jgi:hypothetical protein
LSLASMERPQVIWVEIVVEDESSRSASHKL